MYVMPAIYFILIINKFTAFLNRQIITLLSGQGIPDHVFQKLQDDMLRNLNEMLYDNIVARKMLLATPDQHGFSSIAVKMLKVQ